MEKICHENKHLYITRKRRFEENEWVSSGNVCVRMVLKFLGPELPRILGCPAGRTSDRSAGLLTSFDRWEVEAQSLVPQSRSEERC